MEHRAPPRVLRAPPEQDVELEAAQPSAIPRSVFGDAAAIRSPALPAAALALLVWVLWAHYQGGFSATQWGSLGAAVLAALAIALLALRSRVDLRERARVVSLTTLGLFCAWNFLSIRWADFSGDAWAAADITLIYAAGFAVFALWRWTAAGSVLVLGAFVAGVTVVGAIALADSVANPASSFIEGRLLTPVGYPNGAAALWMSAAWPALFLAGSVRVPRALRALSLGACAFLVELAMLGQSRGWALFAPLLLAAAFVLTRQRLRLALAAILVAAGVGGASSRLLDVHDNLVKGGDGSAVSHAATAIALTSGLVCLAGGIWAIADGRVRISRHTRVVLAVGLALLALAGIGGAATAAVHAVDHPGAWISARWHEFTGGESLQINGRPRFFASASSGRYGEWRVAWHEFVAHPVTGIGADNYAAAYLQQRDNNVREPRYPHSLELRILSQLGVIGAALFGVFVGSALLLAFRRRRHLDAVDASIVAAALMVFFSWLVSGSVDWFWEIPALGAPALAFLGLAGAVSIGPVPRARGESQPKSAQPPVTPLAVPVSALVGASLNGTERETAPPDLALEPDPEPAVKPTADPDASGDRPPPSVPRTLALAGCLVLVVGIVSVGVPALAQSYANAGVAGWQQDPARSYARLERAASLNPLSGDPLLLEGSIALRLGDARRARDAFDRVLAREPRNWYANLQLAMLYGSVGNRPLAAAYLARAQALNPNDKVAKRLETLLGRGSPIIPNELNDRYVNAFEQRGT